MTKDEEALVELVISERMKTHVEHMEQRPEEVKNKRLQLDDAFQTVLSQLTEEQTQIIMEHEDMITAVAGEEARSIYLGGVKDGYKINKVLIAYLEKDEH